MHQGAAGEAHRDGHAGFAQGPWRSCCRSAACFSANGFVSTPMTTAVKINIIHQGPYPRVYHLAKFQNPYREGHGHFSIFFLNKKGRGRHIVTSTCNCHQLPTEATNTRHGALTKPLRLFALLQCVSCSKTLRLNFALASCNAKSLQIDGMELHEMIRGLRSHFATLIPKYFSEEDDTPRVTASLAQCCLI